MGAQVPGIGLGIDGDLLARMQGRTVNGGDLTMMMTRSPLPDLGVEVGAQWCASCDKAGSRRFFVVAQGVM